MTEVRNSPLRVGAVLFPGFELLDIYGPVEMFGLLGNRARVTMLAEASGPVPSSCGPQGFAETALADAWDLDLLLVPGGIGTRNLVRDDAWLAQLSATANRAGTVASICTGSALLARAGLLDGRRATSNKLVFDWVARQGPAVDWVRRARWVEDGRFFTSSGISAGMDLALALIERFFDESAAREVALQAEYVWNADPNNDPFSSEANQTIDE